MALYRHIASGTFPGESWSFTLHTLGSADLPTAQASWSGAVAALWTGALDAIIATDVEVTEVSTASLTQATGGQISRLIDDVTLPGVAAGQTLPAQCSCCISWGSTLATRAGQGRSYLPPFAVSVMSAGKISAAATTVVADAAHAMVAALEGDGLNPVLYSRTTHLTTPITKGNVGDVMDTQRRRRNKLIEVRTAFAV